MAGYIYDIVPASLLLFSAKTIGSMLCFFVARNFLSEKRKQGFHEYTIIKKVNKVIHSSPFYYGTLVRYAALPTAAKNYGLSLMNITFLQYITCCVLGSIIYVPVQASAGKAVMTGFLSPGSSSSS